jgi:twitching motility protein PilT
VEITELLRHAVEVGASDLHLKAGNVPFVRVDGELSPTEFEAMTAADTEAASLALMPEHKLRAFEETSEADFGYTLGGVGRFRVNVFRQRSMVGLAIRRVRSEVPTVAELMLPPVIAELSDSSRGLVLVTGPTGTGKTTTIASMVGHINRTRRAHIVTIEDPIEVVHHDERSIIQQREVGLDTDSYAAALRHVVRQDPDVIFVGEIRDPESALSAIQAAETGHLVISTMHTIDSTETINRLLDLFPAQQQREVRTSFAGALRGIVSQRLVKRSDGKGRVPVVEVLVSTGRVYDRIIDPDATIELHDIIAEGGFYGMQTFDHALVSLVEGGLVTEEDARFISTSPHDFVLALRGTLTRS